MGLIELPGKVGSSQSDRIWLSCSSDVITEKKKGNQSYYALLKNIVYNIFDIQLNMKIVTLLLLFTSLKALVDDIVCYNNEAG